MNEAQNHQNINVNCFRDWHRLEQQLFLAIDSANNDEEGFWKHKFAEVP